MSTRRTWLGNYRLPFLIQIEQFSYFTLKTSNNISFYENSLKVIIIVIHNSNIVKNLQNCQLELSMDKELQGSNNVVTT